MKMKNNKINSTDEDIMPLNTRKGHEYDKSEIMSLNPQEGPEYDTERALSYENNNVKSSSCHSRA